ncbi:MAG: hypothetical protein LZF60_160141 [Nitrospira sp.]|nr:MAG: hypothetical protein LZF60_160141 [Nitrospira sp.]
MDQELSERQLVGAAQLEKASGLKRRQAYSMAAAGLIPFYRVGRTRRGIRFRLDEVLAALRQPAVTEK